MCGQCDLVGLYADGIFCKQLKTLVIRLNVLMWKALISLVLYVS
jgi:hypothetical protein